jgi:NAD(P)H-flavin reductase
MIVPLAWFVIDRFVARRPRRTIATAVEVLSSGVTKLSIVRPRDFEHDAADYVFVRIPAVARGEWHPFTISSAPERSDALTLHVRSSGNWTSALYRLAKARSEGEAPLEVWLDGPYGTPSTHAFESRFVVMVAAGIGVTPFASVLASMRERLKRDFGLSVEKVYFVWVCREQESFEWFSSELGRLERADPARFDVRIFMDAGDRDLKSSVLRVAMDSLYATVQADLVTGLRSRTTLGRPDWDALLSELAAAHAPETVDCFFCGPDGLATIVKDACARHGLGFRQEHF